MDTQTTTVDVSGNEYNRFKQRIIKCAFYSECGRRTTMTGTRLCDGCYSLGRDKADLDYVHVLPSQAEIDAGPHAYLCTTPEDYRLRVTLFDGLDEVAVKKVAGNEIWVSMKTRGVPDGFVDRRMRSYFDLNRLPYFRDHKEA